MHQNNILSFVIIDINGFKSNYCKKNRHQLLFLCTEKALSNPVLQ